jgi:hypothetical protein
MKFSMIVAAALQRAAWTSSFANPLNCHFPGGLGVDILLWPAASDHTKKGS